MNLKESTALSVWRAVAKTATSARPDENAGVTKDTTVRADDVKEMPVAATVTGFDEPSPKRALTVSG